MSGGGFMSFMNSVITNNRKLLKNKRKFKERTKFYDVSKSKKENFQIRDLSEEEKILKRKLKKSEFDKTYLIYSLVSIIILSLSLNIYLGFFNENIEIENPSKKRLKKLYEDNIRIGDRYFRSEKWEETISYYKKGIEFFPENFNGHQKLIVTLSQKCKKEYNFCNEARDYINYCRPIFLERQNELKKLMSKLEKIKEENYE
jgi:hypothetical protein